MEICSEHLIKLAHAGKKLGEISGTAGLYDVVFKLVEDIFDSDCAAVLLKDPNTQKFKIAAAKGYKSEVVKNFSVAPGNGITGHVLSTGEPQIVFETINDPRYIQGVPNAISEISVPLWSGNEIIGVLDLESKSKRFNKEHLKLFSAFGEMVGASVRYLRLQSQMERRASRLVSIAKAGQSQNASDGLLPLLYKILDSFNEALKLNTCYVMLLDETEENMVIVSALDDGKCLIGKKYPVGSGISGNAASKNCPIIVKDVSKDDNYIEGIKETKSQMAVPLVFREKVKGVLCAENKLLNGFDDTDLLHATVFADQISAVVGYAKLQEELLQERKKGSQTAKNLEKSDYKLKNITDFLDSSENPSQILDQISSVVKS